MRSLRRVLLGYAVLLPAITLLAARAGAQVSSSSQNRPVGIHRMRGASSTPAAAATAASSPAIPYNGGAVLPSPTTYAYWWGLPSDFPSDAVDGLDHFLEGLDGSLYLDIANEYMLGQTAHTRFGGNLFDHSAPPSDPFAVNAQGNFVLTPEVCKVLNDNGLTPDPTAIYTIYSSNFPFQGSCASHGYDNCADGTNIHFVYVPNFTSVLSACGTNFDPLFTPNIHSEGTRAMASATAHEFMESITDPNFDGWVAPDGTEVGDLCPYVFQTWVPLTNSRWKIQEIWSDQAGGCVPGSGRNARVLGGISNSRAAITTFDIPAATYGTFSQSINIFGAVAGFYTDATNEFHAFARDILGNVSTIDPPGTGSYLGAQALSINAGGAITGNYGDTNFVLHGFVRDNQGNFVTFDAPGSAGTSGNSINNKGVIAGDFSDANSANHGFVRDSQGNFATFDAPGAANGSYGGTFVLSINALGGVTGNYLDANSVSHGFVRHADGTIATIDAPGASQGTFPQSINALGAIAGYYSDAKFVSHGFVRDLLGNITTFDDPKATSGTFALSINGSGAVGGYYSDASGFPHGFVRDIFGKFSTLSAPSTDYGNVVRSINDLGATAGYDTKAVF